MRTDFPTIVVAFYNRKEPALRLFKSLSEAEYPVNEKVNLVISIDNDNNKGLEIKELADRFEWNFGPKEVIFHPKNLGLRDHFNFCGDLTQKYGSVIFLEDDLYVSPWFYDYALQALAYFEKDKNVAGISLYSYKRIEQRTNPWPFEAIDDGADNYFLQQASWGQIWTWDMWKPFKSWYHESGKPEIINSMENLPNNIKRWPNSSWKKNYIAYMILHGKYYVFPRISLATNFDDVGLHRRLNTVNLQNPILVGKKIFRFKTFSESLSIYDSFFELLPEIVKKFNPQLKNWDFEMNLYGQKDITQLKKEYVISKNPGKIIERSFGLRFKPHDLNLLFDLEGTGLFLCKAEKLHSKQSRHINFVNQFVYFYRGHLQFGELWSFVFFKILSRWKKFRTKFLKKNRLNI